MTATTPQRATERIGHWAGGLTRAYLRRERQATGWLVAQGWPEGVARGAVLAVKLGSLGLLLYAAFWFALTAMLLVFAAQQAHAVGDQDNDDAGASSLDDLRRSAGYDPNVYNDASHEMYEDR